jgi:Putative transposase
MRWRRYDLLFRASAETLLEVAANPKRLGAELGFLSVLHTWGQTLQHHPHVHCVIPAGGLSPDRKRWISARTNFFLPVHVLSAVFRGKFTAGLRRLWKRKKLCLPGTLRPLQQEKTFRGLLRTLHGKKWIVYSKPPFGGPEHVLHYLARYTHRVAISNHRITNFADGKVSFRWKDYANGSQQRVMTVDSHEFLRRFLQHILPQRFVRIRSFGFLSNRRRKESVALCRQLLAVPPSSAPPAAPTRESTWRCPQCGGPMIVVARLSARDLLAARKKGPVILDSS